MKELNQGNPIHTPRPSRSLPLWLRIAIAFAMAFVIVFVLILVGANRRWYHAANTTGNEVLAYSVSAPTGTPMPSEAALSSTAAAPTDSSTNPSADEAANVAVLAYSTLELGDDNSAVIELQMRLMELGYMDYDEPSSIYNEATQTAVMLFQRAIDMDMTGVADNAVQTLLYGDSAQKYQIKLSDTGSDVRRVQLRLADLGYYEDKASGYYGPMTEVAVMRFQTHNNLPVTGLFSYSTYQQLYSSSAVEAPEEFTPTPTPSPTPKPRSTSAGSAKTKAPASATDSASKTSAPSDAQSQPTDSATDAVQTEAPTKAPDSSGNKSYGNGTDGIVSCAIDQLGKPYILGDEGPGSFDCSGLVYFCLRSGGVSTGRLNSTSFSNKSSWTLVSSVDGLQKGDIVCFKSDTSDRVNHVGIYIGGGSFVHASSSKGAVVRSAFSSDTSSYWQRNFVCGRRPIG